MGGEAKHSVGVGDGAGRWAAVGLPASMLIIVGCGCVPQWFRTWVTFPYGLRLHGVSCADTTGPRCTGQCRPLLEAWQPWPAALWWEAKALCCFVLWLSCVKSGFWAALFLSLLPKAVVRLGPVIHVRLQLPLTSKEILLAK